LPNDASREVVDEIHILCEGDEFVGGQDTPTRVVPPCEHFEAIDAAMREIDHRLIERHDLPARDGIAQL
jgi:hypothetical protein